MRGRRERPALAPRPRRRRRTRPVRGVELGRESVGARRGRPKRAPRMVRRGGCVKRATTHLGRRHVHGVHAGRTRGGGHGPARVCRGGRRQGIRPHCRRCPQSRRPPPSRDTRAPSRRAPMATARPGPGGAAAPKAAVDFLTLVGRLKAREGQWWDVGCEVVAHASSGNDASPPLSRRPRRALAGSAAACPPPSRSPTTRSAWP